MPGFSTQATYALTGPLTIHTGAELRCRLLEHMQGARSLVLDCSGIAEADTSGVQLLVSARRSATAQGLPFGLVNPSDALSKACLAAGVSLEHQLSPLPQ